MRSIRTLAAAGTACLALAGLGVATGAASGTQTVRVSAKLDRPAFVQKSLRAKHGKITFAFTNKASTGHSFAIETLGRKPKDLGSTPVIKDGKTAKLPLTLKKGRYRYYCTVPGHEDAGMKGILTVR